jgi:glycosyltransferase involved in cell wall biosynthesis
MRMDASILICTYNRAESLRRTLTSLARMEPLPDAQWEVLVVDNRSTDNTEQVCREFEGRLPIRYCMEPTPGKSAALNTAIRSTTADLLLFTDDDVDVDPLWLKGFTEAAARMPDVPFFAGRILARLEGNPPRWFAEHAQSTLSQLTVQFDPGDRESPSEGAFGANMAIRAEVFRKGISFRRDLGPVGTKRIPSEEAQLFQDIRAAGWSPGAYIPAALLYHRTNSSRMTEAYVRQWYYSDGIARVRRNQIDPCKLLFKVPRYAWRELLVSAVRYAVLRPFAPSKSWLPEEMAMARTLGIISEFRRMKKGTSPADKSKQPCT